MNKNNPHNQLYQSIPGTHIKNLDTKKAMRNFKEVGFLNVMHDAMIVTV